MKRILKNTSYLAVSEALNKVLFLALIILLARKLDLASFGKYSFALAFFTLFLQLSDFGLYTFTVRDISRSREKIHKYFGNLFWIRAFASLLVVMMMVLAIRRISPSADVVISVYILCGAYLATTMRGQFFSFFLAFQNAKYVAYSRMIHDVAVVSVAMFFLFSGGSIILIVSSFLAGSLLSLAYSAVVLFARFGRLNLNLDFSVCRYILSNSVVFMISNVFSMMLFKIGILMLSLLKGNAAVGIYNAALAPVTNLDRVFLLYFSAAFPAMSFLFVTNPQRLVALYKKCYMYLVPAYISVMVPLLLLSDWIIPLIFGGKFLQSAAVFRILLFAGLFFVMGNINIVMLNAVNRHVTNAILFAAAASLNIAINLVLIPRYSFIGAAVSSCISYAFLFITTSACVREFCFRNLKAGPVRSVKDISGKAAGDTECSR
ncbi:MAG: flippase [archaeon]